MSESFEIDFSRVITNLAEESVLIQQAAKLGVQDSIDDLKRIAVDIAPIDSGDLRRSGNAKVRKTRAILSAKYHLARLIIVAGGALITLYGRMKPIIISAHYRDKHRERTAMMSGISTWKDH
jgi:hypothetical protein